MKTYTPLHVHSLYSNLDGLSKVKDIVSRCKEVGAHGACITDHAFATSHYLLSEECSKQGIKPIFAVEGYLSPFENTVKSKIENFKNYYHITMIAKNEIGYKNLMILIADSFLLYLSQSIVQYSFQVRIIPSTCFRLRFCFSFHFHVSRRL